MSREISDLFLYVNYFPSQGEGIKNEVLMSVTITKNFGLTSDSPQ